jgi:hypothetical protein
VIRITGNPGPTPIFTALRYFQPFSALPILLERRYM